MRSACLRFLLVAFAASGGLCSLRAQDSADLLKRGAALARACRSAEAEALLSSIKDPSAALLYLRRAVQLEPNDPLLYEDMASVYAELGLSQKAGEAREEALRTLNAELLYTQSARARTDGRRSEAERLLRQCVQTNPRLSKAWTDLGEILRESNRPDEALRSFQRALEADPANRLARLGAAAVMEERTDNARPRKSKKPLEKDGPVPLESDAGGALAERERNGEAAAILLRAVREYPDNADLLARLGHLQEAIDLFEGSLKRYGPDGWVYFNLGYLYQSVGNIPSAISNYRRARQLSPQDPETNHNLAFALYLSKEYASALEPFRAAVRLKPGWGLAHFSLAMNYWNLQRYAQALTHARIAEEKGLPGAARVVQALSANLSLGMPKSVTVSRRKS